jgi:hypothetical protein
MDQSKILNFFPVKSSSENPLKDTSMRSSDAFYLLDFENNSQEDEEKTENKSVSFFSFRVLTKEKNGFSTVNKCKSNNAGFTGQTKSSLSSFFNKSNIQLNLPTSQNTPSTEDKYAEANHALVKRNIEDYFVKKNTIDINDIHDPQPMPSKRTKANNLLNWLQPKRKEQANNM